MRKCMKPLVLSNDESSTYDTSRSTLRQPAKELVTIRIIQVDILAFAVHTLWS